MAWVITASIVFILIVGSIVALWWWRLASRLAPYEDELGRRRPKPPVDKGEVVVISRSGEPRSNH